MRVLDNHDLFLEHQSREDDRIARLPVCDWCKEPIQDEQFYKVDGEYICKHCMDGCLVDTEDYTV